MEVKKGYKEIEGYIIPNDWQLVPLGDFLKFKNGLNKEKHYFGVGTPIVNYMDVYKNRGLKENDILGKVTLTFQEIKNYDVRKGDILFTRTSETVDEIGISSVILEEISNTVFSGFVLRARPKDNRLESLFAKYCFSTKSVRKEIISQSTYTTRALTNGRQLSKVKIALPSTKKEQSVIAEVLSDIDSLIANLEKLIKKKELVKKGTMQTLLSGKKRLPGFTKKWEAKRIGEISNIESGGTPSTSVASYWGGNIRWMNSGELNLKKVYDVENRITELGVKNSSTKTIPPKCILIGLAGQGKTRGTVAINYVELCTNQSIAAILPNYSFLPEFLYYNLDSRYDELRLLSAGDGGRGGLNLTILKNLVVLLPERDEQIAIAQSIGDMDKELEKLILRLKKYQYLKQGLMQQLLTGKIRLV
jgi:type I restriction enzyme S subunit